MPTVAIVDGAKLLFYANDHPPPRFHVLFAEHRAVIDIKTLKLVRGGMPRPKLQAVLRWATPRRNALLEAWDVTQAHGDPEKIR